MTHEKYVNRFIMKTVDFRDLKDCPKCGKPLMIAIRYEGKALRQRCASCGCFVSEDLEVYIPRHVGKTIVEQEYNPYYFGKHEPKSPKTVISRWKLAIPIEDVSRLEQSFAREEHAYK